MILATWAVLALLVSLPFVVWAVVALTRQPHDSREVPADAWRYGVMVAFAAFVDLSVGLLAAVGIGWALYFGRLRWTRLDGAFLWPLVAMAIWMISAAGDGTLLAAASSLLVVGVIQTLLALRQAYYGSLVISRDHRQVHGTLGHRTGLGIYLAVLVPMAFLMPTPVAWSLVTVYAVGLLIARSAVATVAAVAGLVWAQPGLWPYALTFGVSGLAWRFTERASTGLQFGWAHFRPDLHRGALGARFRVWRVAISELRYFPHWLIGYGPGAFKERAGTWTIYENFQEVYREAHNDYLEFVYEYGLVGAVAAVLWFVRFGPGLAAADPVTGGLVALGTASLGNFPLKVAPLAVVGLLLGVMVMRRA